jgi:hypothetical protein
MENEQQCDDNADLVIIAIDIEARGPGPRSHGIVSIGVCVGSTTSEEDHVIEKCRFDLKRINLMQKYEKRCFDEFWSKNLDLKSELTCNAKDAREQMNAFRQLIDKYPNAYIVCDNPGFDFGMINYYLDFYGLATLNYDSKGGYQNTHDSDSYARGKLGYGLDKPWMSNDSVITRCRHDFPHTIVAQLTKHMPEDDAELIYHLHKNIMKL